MTTYSIKFSDTTGSEIGTIGDPAPNAPKWFAAIEIIRLAADKDWLNKATKEVSNYWKHKRQRYFTSI